VKNYDFVLKWDNYHRYEELTKFRVFTMVINVGVSSFKTHLHLRNYNVIEKDFLCINHIIELLLGR
jgi:hypothetical protein